MWPFRRRKKKTGRALQLYSPNRVSARHDAFRQELEALSHELPDSLIASGDLVREGQASLLRRLIQPWQIRAFGYYDLIGEIKFASQFYSRSLSNLELYAAEVDENGDLVRTENPAVVDALARIKDPGGGGRSGLLAAYGRLMFLVGEAYLFVSINPHTGLEQWEMLSTDELRILDGSYTRYKAPSYPANLFKPAPDDAYVPVDDDTAVAYRLWKRHPRYSSLGDSTMAGVLDICELLVMFQAALRARARSRLAGSGVLFLDDRITTDPQEPTPDEDPIEDPFVADLTDAMTSPILDEGTSSAVVPLVARVRVPEGMKLSDLVYHLQIIDPQQIYPETGLITEQIDRLATSLDLPADILKGLTDANHWSAWLVDEQSWKAHLQPVAQQLVEDMTSAYLMPYLKDELSLPDWDRYSIAYDASAIINHPDRTKDAKDLHAEGVIGDQALREAAGFDEDDEPTPEELNRWLGVKLRDASVAIYGIPSLRTGGIEPEAGVIETGTGGEVAGPVSAETNKLPPEKPTEPVGENVVGAAAMIEGAAQISLLRAREAAGAKIRTACRRDDEALALIDGVQARDVASTLGSARVRALVGGPKEGDLVNGARPLIMEALRTFGVKDAQVAGLIADTLESHAVRTLYEPRAAPLPPTFNGYVRGLLASSNGKGG